MRTMTEASVLTVLDAMAYTCFGRTVRRPSSTRISAYATANADASVAVMMPPTTPPTTINTVSIGKNAVIAVRSSRIRENLPLTGMLFRLA